MPSCCVSGCGNYWKKKGKNANVQYHVFPRDYSRASEWLRSIKQNFVYNTLQTKRVCSEHFSDKCYTRDLRNELMGLPKRKFLSPDAVPDINIPTGSIADTDHSDLQNDETSITSSNESHDIDTEKTYNNSEDTGTDNESSSLDEQEYQKDGYLRSKKGVMPQCKDRLRYRWLGFHLDLTTSARLRSAAPPARRPRSKRRRPRKQDDPRVEAFNLLFALGLVPTKSRMNDPQGLLLNRMHVMDGDCPKSEVIAEKAPELDLSTPRSVPITNDSNGVTSTSTIADTTAALTVTNTANCNNNNSIHSTKDKDVVNNFSSAATKHVLQYLPAGGIDKKNNTTNLLPVNDVVSDSVNESVDKKKKKKSDCGFDNVDSKVDVVDKMITDVVNNSEIDGNDKVDDYDNKSDDKFGVNNNDDSLNHSCKLVNGNKDDNSANESSDVSDDSHDRIDESANVNNVGDDSSTGVKSGVIDEDVEEDTPADMLVEEEEVDEDIEDEDDIEIDKNIEDDILEENDTDEPEQKSQTVKIDTKTNVVSPKQEQVEEDKKPVTQDVPLDMYIVRKESTAMDVVNESSAVISLNSSSVGDIPSSIKSTLKEESCVTSNTNAVPNNNGSCSEEDRTSVTSSQSRKRTIGERDRGEGEAGGGEVDNEVEGENEGEGSSSESEGGTKRQRVVVEAEDERERLVREYVERCTQSVEEMSRNADKLQREIGALGELARAKELEWNSILRLRKLKEEMLERLLRRRRQAMMLADNGLTQDWATDYTKPKVNKQLPNNHNHNQLMMVPVVSSSPGNLPPTVASSISSRPILSSPDTTRTIARMQQRPILPKPLISHSHHNLNSNLNSSSLLDQQNTIIGEGRQGPILDVKSIIADYRSRNPDNVPRRGRRMKSPMVSSTRISGSPALMSMANMALCSGAHIRNTSQECTSVQDNSRPSSTDSTRSAHQTELPAPGLSFKDVLVQFAKMSQPPPPTPAPPIKQPPPPPPPYPEVTLHPVPAPQSPPPTHSSLLHGILTKTTAAPSSTTTANHRPTTFSPTLARLLTAPERDRTAPMMTSQFRPPTSRVSISDLLTSSKKTRNEITITPVSSQSPVKSKDEVVLLDDDEETDSTDRLVIDESADNREGNNNGDVNSDDVPECQGCHQRAALFVCAGCGNQWYCSRECQVTAWEEHCETCSG